MPSQSEAGPSSAPSNLSLRPANVLTIFLAEFHVRQGNTITYQYPSVPKSKSKGELIDIDDQEEDETEGHGTAVDLNGVEWKVLPSGGHLIQKDVIYFQTSLKGSTGVACFRNIKLDSANTQATAQRGARMVSVGLILQCEGQVEQHASSLAQQLAIVPHLNNLEKLADELAHDPEDTDPLRAYYLAHRARSHANGTATSGASNLDGKRMKQLRMRRRRDPRNLPYDPISHMPALCGSLGPLLPHLLKKLMLPHHRLLIFSPAPPLVYAAHLGFNLADLIALAISRSGKRHENLHAFARRGIVHVKGQIGVHDIPALEDEEKQRSKTAKQKQEALEDDQSWIAWSTDKILLEKPHLFDSVLDLTPLITRDSKGGVLDEAALESANTMAKLLTVKRPESGKVQLKAESWTTREFATFNELDAQAQRHAKRAERLGGNACISRRRSRSRLKKASATGARQRPSEDAQNARGGGEIEYAHQQPDSVSQWRGGCARSPRRSGAGTLSAILAFLRYWLAGWWFLPSHWRYGLPAAYVLPLGIRGDGGVRASILVMPEDESDDEEDQDVSDGDDDGDGGDARDLDYQEDREIAAEDERQEEEQRRSALVAEPDMILATIHDGADDLSVPQNPHQPHTRNPIALEDQNTSTNSSSEDTAGLPYPQTHSHHSHHLIPPDPLLAAVGASPLRHHHSETESRLSHSRASLRRRSTDRSLYARSSSHGGAATGVGGGDPFEDYPSSTGSPFDLTDSENRFRTILSDSLWMVWSHWTTALISGLLDILEDRLAQIESEDPNARVGDGGEEDGDVSQLLIAKVTQGLELHLGQTDMASLGLSAGNQVDVRLVEILGGVYLKLLTSSIVQYQMHGEEEDAAAAGEAKVKVKSGWGLFRWLL